MAILTRLYFNLVLIETHIFCVFVLKAKGNWSSVLYPSHLKLDGKNCKWKENSMCELFYVLNIYLNIFNLLFFFFYNKSVSHIEENV